MFDSHYIPVIVILKKAAAAVSHSHVLLVISKQTAIIVSHSCPSLFFGNGNFTLFTLAFAFTSIRLWHVSKRAVLLEDFTRLK